MEVTRLVAPFVLVALFVRPIPLLARDTEPAADEYRIGPEDVLDVTLWNHPDVARIVPVIPTDASLCRSSTMWWCPV